MIDRYEPSDRRASRDDFYSASREHTARDREDRRRPPSPMAANIDRYVPGQDAGKRSIPSNPLPNPLNLDFQVGFNWFAEWWRAEQAIKEEKERAKHGGRRPSDRVKGEREAREDRDRERAQIQAAYDTYKVDLQVKMARAFVQQHKNDEWFKERYIPEIRDPLRQKLMEFRVGAYQQWERDLDGGLFDDFTLEGIYKSESDGAGGVIEKEEGETTAVGETLGVLDLLPARGGDLRDEALSQPALLIKTLAPNVSRQKIEEFCKEHLGEQDGGFRWLSLSDPNPSKKYHRMGWIMLHPAPDVAVVERGDGREEEGEMDQDNVANGSGAATVAEKALEATNDKTIHDPVHGDFVCHVGVHAPPAQLRKKALWDLFSSPDRIERDLELARRLVGKLDSEMGHGADGYAKVEERVEELRGKGWLQPPVTGPVSVRRRKSNFDADDVDEGEAEEGEEQEDWADDEVDDEELLAKKKKLDLMVEYLRRVYNFCFFCVFESDSLHELTRKCPGGHLRRPRSGLTTQAKAVAKASALGQPFPVKRKDPSEEGEEQAPPSEKERRSQRYSSKSEQQLQRAFNWVKTFEDKILQILEPENVDIVKLGGKPVDEALEEELTKHVKQEDESKFRCKVPECTKLFKAEHFWRKHVEKRHSEWYERIKNDLALVNAYVLDPARIAPSRSDANSNGHFPLSSGQNQTGTPRGFSLAAMPPYLANGAVAAGLQGVPGGLPGFVSNQASWAANGMAGGELHQPGVMRRGGNRYNNNRSGPYDRRGNRHGTQGFGRMSPGRGMLNMGSGGRLPAAAGAPYIPPGHPAAAFAGTGGFPDAIGSGPSQQAMGPREAVQGRSLKSYEDLDAVGGAGSGELNY
ncbi:hypothetical protein BDW60DRAFT_207966 [Aspergillus nidulans var. acristatus]